MKRILFITSTRIGDAVLSTGLLDHVLKLAPRAQVTVACGPAAAPLFQDCPQIARIHIMDKTKGQHWFGLWRASVLTPWDMVIDLRSSAIAYLLWSGYRYVLRKPLSGGEARHRVVEIGEVMGLKPPPAPRLWISENARAKAKVLLAGAGPFLALGPTANFPGKQWPAERFADLAVRLTGAHGPMKGAHVAVLSGPGEEASARAVISRLPSERVIDLAGRLSLNEAGAILEKASLYVGNDSGLMHIAAAAGAPTLGLFGPSPEQLYRPWGPKAAFVREGRSFEDLRKVKNFDHSGGVNYMTDLSVDTAEKGARFLLEMESTARG